MAGIGRGGLVPRASLDRQVSRDYAACVLTADVRFEGFTAEDWQRFLHLWKPRAPPEREEVPAQGGLIVVHDGERARKMLHTVKGRLEPSIPWPLPLRDLAELQHADWVLSLHMGALDE